MAKSKSSSKPAKAKGSYDADALQLKQNIDHVRERPAMYIGGTDKHGLHHIAWEILDNAVDEVINGHASKIEVVLEADRKGITIRDDGRGVPVDIHPELKIPAVIGVYTQLGMGAKFGGDSYAHSGGLHGVGATVANALAERLENEELGNIVKALGCGIGKDFKIDGLRYERIILLMDADSDGHHIATLLLTFFYKYMPELIRRGHVYIAQPPLFRVDVGKETFWAADDKHLQRILAGITRGKPEIQRFKGLGEMMPATLRGTTLDPKKRQLIRVAIHDELATDRTIHDLMGKDAGTRYEFIMERAAEADEIDI